MRPYFIGKHQFRFLSVGLIEIGVLGGYFEAVRVLAAISAPSRALPFVLSAKPCSGHFPCLAQPDQEVFDFQRVNAASPVIGVHLAQVAQTFPLVVP